MGKKKLINGLTEKEVEALKQKLLDEKNKMIFNGIIESEEFNLQNDDLSDEVDQANSDSLNAQRLRFRNREVFYLRKINKALDRLSTESYGECEECGCPIGFTRLMARPTAEMCIECKEEMERDESCNFVQRQSKSQGKAINLVKVF